jgi:DNA polymerase-3 subunit epsilon
MSGNRNQQLVRQQRFAAVDFESAGSMRGGTDFPVQIGIACWSYENGWEPGFVSYLHCPQEVSWQASRVHGISTSDLVDAPRLVDLWPEIRSRLSGAVVVAHARGTEKKFLRTFPGHGFSPWIDTLVWARRMWPEMKDHSLARACQEAQILDVIHALCPSLSWHDALYDATASMALMRHWILTQELLNSPIEHLIQE